MKGKLGKIGEPQKGEEEKNGGREACEGKLGRSARVKEGKTRTRKVIFPDSVFKHRNIPTNADKIHMLEANDTHSRGEGRPRGGGM